MKGVINMEFIKDTANICPRCKIETLKDEGGQKICQNCNARYEKFTIVKGDANCGRHE